MRSKQIFFYVVLILFQTVNEISNDFESHFGGTINKVSVSGNYAYMLQGQDLLILDISDSTNPLEVGKLVTPSEVWDVFVEGNYAYVAADSALFMNSQNMFLKVLPVVVGGK